MPAARSAEVHDLSTFEMFQRGKGIRASSKATPSALSRIDWDGEREEWNRKVLSKLKGLNELEENWDTYGNGRVSSDSIAFASQVLWDIWQPSVGIPLISPMSNEGISIEFSSVAAEFTIEIFGPYDGIAFIETEDGNDIQETSVHNNLTELHRMFRHFMELAAA